MQFCGNLHYCLSLLIPSRPATPINSGRSPRRGIERYAPNTLYIAPPRDDEKNITNFKLLKLSNFPKLPNVRLNKILLISNSSLLIRKKRSPPEGRLRCAAICRKITLRGCERDRGRACALPCGRGRRSSQPRACAQPCAQPCARGHRSSHRCTPSSQA